MRRLLDPLLSTATVAGTGPDAGRIRALTLSGEDIARWEVIPGQQVRIQVGADNRVVDRLVGALRTYSVWAHHGSRLDLRVVDHGEGPGARWVRTVRPGDQVRLTKPQGTFVCRPSGYHLFVGDETASVAFGAMIRGLDDGAPAYALIEVDAPAEQLGIPREVTWIHRYGRPAANSTRLVDALAALDLPDTPGTAYLAGEARTIQLVRDHLVRTRGWQRSDIITKPFWTPGKTGME
ncbi:siderophore-interacting protein [Streptomyces sp. NBC_01476]|uniref:siderophore-interacting protein n=1 Tax=Streptomyces sp. NBC_01476 TaxID=2903881 RepID=UPI002E32E587|nr:siderophore-interacting protein [Streptomyces sp. NBC_01476]